MREEDIRVHITGEQSVSASWYDRDHPYNRGTVDLSGFGEPDNWWVNRAVINGRPGEELRGKGLGSRLLQLALSKAVEMGATRVRVCPSGYNSDYKQQQRFYEKNGFIRQREASEEEVWEWRP